MRRIASWTLCFVAIMFMFASAHAQAKLSIRAASPEPVEGWQLMQVEHSNRVIWVSPTASLTRDDIENAHPEVTAEGNNRIAVILTDAGAKKMRDLTIAQKGKLIALVV